MNIQASKQVGPLYYMVKDIEVLKVIVLQEAIRTSIKAEPTGQGNGSKHYISFLRDLTKANRNPNRWVYGIQIDGDKLSDKYKISPYSFAGNTIKGSYFRVKTLTKYDNGSCTLSLVNWPTLDIPEYIFKEIEDLILSDVQGVNEKKNLQVTTGSRRVKGKLIVTKYNYNTKNGGIRINSSNISDKSLSYLLKHTSFNESEERIWVIDDSIQFIRLPGLITGYIEPKGDNSIEKAIQDEQIPEKLILKY